jgi:hypothetical protein
MPSWLMHRALDWELFDDIPKSSGEDCQRIRKRWGFANDKYWPTLPRMSGTAGS